MLFGKNKSQTVLVSSSIGLKLKVYIYKIGIAKIFPTKGYSAQINQKNFDVLQIILILIFFI